MIVDSLRSWETEKLPLYISVACQQPVNNSDHFSADCPLFFLFFFVLRWCLVGWQARECRCYFFKIPLLAGGYEKFQKPVSSSMLSRIVLTISSLFPPKLIDIFIISKCWDFVFIYLLNGNLCCTFYRDNELLFLSWLTWPTLFSLLQIIYHRKLPSENNVKK